MENGILNFKAFKDSVKNFTMRHDFSLRRFAQLNENLVEFQCFVIAVRKKYQYALQHTGNADMTPDKKYLKKLRLKR